MMFSFAVLVIHTCFRTDHRNWAINQTSSYVDLAPLYGWNQETQDKVRVEKEQRGRGLLKPDVFAEDRLLFLPPAAAAVLVLLCRNHNYIAAKLLDNNEYDRFNKDLSKLTTEQLLKQDEELFNVARLINCAWFGNIIFSDYFSAILGLCRFGSSWFLNPFEEIRKADHTLVERGAGNAVTVEFNLLYRVRDLLWLHLCFTDD
jgi:linoleate 10R-lipoxygenase